MIDLSIKQSWLEKSSDTALEEFKSHLVEVLNNLFVDRHTEKRWLITKVSENDEAHLIYDEKPIAGLIIRDGSIEIKSTEHGATRYDDLLWAIRYTANRLVLAVYSKRHGGARLPQDQLLSLDHSIFTRDEKLAAFFKKSDYVPRFAREGYENLDDARRMFIIYAPYFAENKHDGTIHIINDAMLTFLQTKENQRVSEEFSYNVADSLQDFARKHDLGLIPTSFYQNFGASTKIINETYFDAVNIKRKVFIDPYVWDFDDEHDYRYYKNIETGMHLMDKVRKGENLDQALKRVLKEELKVAEDYVGARIWGIEFDRDRDGILTPRLRISVYVHGMVQKHKSKDHDWVSIK